MLFQHASRRIQFSGIFTCRTDDQDSAGEWSFVVAASSKRLEQFVDFQRLLTALITYNFIHRKR